MVTSTIHGLNNIKYTYENIFKSRNILQRHTALTRGMKSHT